MAGDLIAIDLVGDRELMRKLDRLAGKMGRTVLRKSMRAASAPVAKTTKANAPVDTQGLKRSIGSKSKWYNSSGTLVVVVGPRIRKGKTVHKKGTFFGTKEIAAIKGQHGYIVEFGTKPRYTKTGAFRGIMPANPFMRRAWDSEKGKAEKLGIKKLLDEVEKEAKRGG